MVVSKDGKTVWSFGSGDAGVYDNFLFINFYCLPVVGFFPVK